MFRLSKHHKHHQYINYYRRFSHGNHKYNKNNAKYVRGLMVSVFVSAFVIISFDNINYINDNDNDSINDDYVAYDHKYIHKYNSGMHCYGNKFIINPLRYRINITSSCNNNTNTTHNSNNTSNNTANNSNNSSNSASNKRRRIVVLGSGWAALSFIQSLNSNDNNNSAITSTLSNTLSPSTVKPTPSAEVVLISPRSYFFYTPLLAGTATGTVSSSSIIEPIRWYCPINANDNNNNDAVTVEATVGNINSNIVVSETGEVLSSYGNPQSFINAECIGIDAKHKTITCQERASSSSSSPITVTLPYDYLVVAVGAKPATFNIPGVKEHALFMKEIEDGIAVKRRIHKQLEHANYLLSARRPKEEIKAALRWIVVGGGPTGVELTAELNDFIIEDVSRYFPHLVPYISVSLLEATGRILGMLDPKTAEYAQHVLEVGGRRDRLGKSIAAKDALEVNPSIFTGASVLVNAMVTGMTADTISYSIKTPGNDSERKNVTESYGMVVWAGGVAMRPITKAIAAQFSGQDSRFGLKVDQWLRVIGCEDNSVFALGDCAVIPQCAPTAQAASQQGKYLRTLFQDTGFDEYLIKCSPGFQYVNYGALAYVGNSRGVAELKPIWELPPFNVNANASGAQLDRTLVSGTSAFAIWRSLYFSKLMSWRNQAQVAFDWIKVGFFGRDIASPETDYRGK